MIILNKRNFLKELLIGVSLVAVLLIVGSVYARSKAPQPLKEASSTSEVENTALRVAKVYKEDHPKVVKVASTRTEAANEPMYSVFLSGEFQKGNIRAPNLSFSVLASGKKVWALRAFNNNNIDVWQDLEIKFGAENSEVIWMDLDKSKTTGGPDYDEKTTQATIVISPPENLFNPTALIEKYITDHGYSFRSETGGGNLVGTKVRLPNSFDAVIDGVKIGELLKQKSELSRLNNLDFSKYLGEQVYIFTWGIEGQAAPPNGLSFFFIIHDEQMVGAWSEPSSSNGEKIKTFSIMESVLKD